MGAGMKVAPFHSSKNPGIYHVCSNCTEGNNIEAKYKTQGKGPGRPRKCKNCKSLERSGDC